MHLQQRARLGHHGAGFRLPGARVGLLPAHHGGQRGGVRGRWGGMQGERERAERERRIST